uniref:Uncharacterized protein n=1 Tax=Romanomermis culicivorax TaxID=13658 RepID=A0A915KFN0_ROMCU
MDKTASFYGSLEKALQSKSCFIICKRFVLCIDEQAIVEPPRYLSFRNPSPLYRPRGPRPVATIFRIK